MVLNPYALSFINLLAASGLLLLTVGYALVLKRRINLLVLLILLACLASWSIFRTGAYESGDFQIHVLDSISFYSSLTEGILFPKWAGDLNATFGYPLFIFTFPLPYYIVSFFHALGFGFIESFKIFLFFSFIFSGLSMYLWIKDILGKFPAFIGSVLYLFAPYHLVDLHFRSSAGELLSFVFMPLILFLLRQVAIKNKLIWMISSAICICFLILSHQAISIAFLPFAFVYGIIELKTKEKRFKEYIGLLFSFGLGFLLSAYYWIPAVFEGIYTKRDLIASIVFPTFREFIFSPYKFGFLFQGPKGELSFLIGYVQILVLPMFFYFLLKNRIKKYQIRILSISFLSIFVVYFFLSLSISKPVWETIPLIKNFQFSYRLLTVIALITSFLGAVSLSTIKNKKIIYLMLIVAISSTLLNWGNRKTLPEINDSVLLNQLPLSTSKIEALQPAFPVWVDSMKLAESEIPNNHLEATGNCMIKELQRTSINHNYLIYAKENCSFKEFTLFFPGWNLYVDGLKHPIQISKTPPKGIILFDLKKGKHEIALRFEDTTLIRLSKTLSGIGVILTLLALILSLPKRKIYIN